MNKLDEAIGAVKRAWDNGFKDSDWARRDPDLAPLHGHPAFERLYPGIQTWLERRPPGRDTRVTREF